MARKADSLDILEEKIATGKKKFVRYSEGAALFSMGLHPFQELAREAGACYKMKRTVLVNVEIVEQYMENFRIPN